MGLNGWSPEHIKSSDYWSHIYPEFQELTDLVPEMAKILALLQGLYGTVHASSAPCSYSQQPQPIMM